MKLFYFGRIKITHSSSRMRLEIKNKSLILKTKNVFHTSFSLNETEEIQRSKLCSMNHFGANGGQIGKDHGEL